MPLKIESRNNPKIKSLIKLQKHNVREKENLFVLEGIKETEKAVKAGYKFDTLFICRDIIDFESVNDIFGNRLPENVYEVSKEVFAKIAYRETTGGIISTVKPKTHNINDLALNKNPLIVILEAVEKPGNLGAVFRTADAAGIDAVFICEPRADLYNPNVIRASIGTVFNVPAVITNSENAIKWLKNNNIQILSTYLKASIPYHTADYTKPTAIVMGTEATGISQQWVKASDKNIIIPMNGMADSLNVSTATAVVVFEAVRQRKIKFAIN